MDAITDSLDRAFDRIDDFEAVQAGATPAQLFDAVLLLLESVGITEESRALIGERLESCRGDANVTGPVLLGIILGLIAAELESESRPRVEA